MAEEASLHISWNVNGTWSSLVASSTVGVSVAVSVALAAAAVASVSVLLLMKVVHVVVVDVVDDVWTLCFLNTTALPLLPMCCVGTKAELIDALVRRYNTALLQ